MYLSGDIGGTKTYLVLRDQEGETLREKKFPSQNYQQFSVILEEFLTGMSSVIKKACFGIAGPVKNNQCHTTNLPWEVDGGKISKKFQIPHLVLLNDLEANAYGIRTLSDEKFAVLNEGVSEKGNQALLSAGTGLGEAGIFFHQEHLIPFPSEGGHVDFSPRNSLEIELLQFLLKRFDHVSYERVLSGMGLENLFDFFVEEKKEVPEESIQEQFQHENRGKVITTNALNGRCGVCEKTLDLFVSLYGAEAGNVALKYLPIGGLYIGGGIAPKILKKMQEETFMKSFIKKGRLQDILKAIPVKVILEENTALHGAMYYVAHCMKYS